MKLKINKAIIIILVCVFCLGYCCTYAQTNNLKFYGVNGHLITQDAYRNNISLQIEKIKECGFNAYRFDIPLDINGNITVPHASLISNILVFQKNKIELTPVLTLPAIENFKEKNLIKLGEAAAKNFINNYGNYFNYIEVGNEVDCILIKSKRGGTDISDYELEKLKNYTLFIKGFNAIIRKKKKQIIISYSFVHWGYLDFLIKNEVDIDIIANHWYSDMGNLFEFNNYYNKNLVDFISNRYKKDFWLNEFNVSGGSFKYIKKDRDTWWNYFMKYFKTHGTSLKSLFIYELFDEEYLDNNEERSYGIFKLNNHYKNAINKVDYLFYKQKNW